MTQRPNFLIMMTDQQRGDSLGSSWRARVGGEESVLQTPNLDRLAADGVQFLRAYVNNPVCMPSRSTLLTGRTPRGHGTRTNGIDLATDIPTLPGTLRDAGYRTHSVGKIHTRIFGTPRGADPATLNPLDFPESRWMWTNGRIDQLPCPYYGFETVDYTGGHGSYIFGDYLSWLERQEKGAGALLTRELGRRPASGAEQTFTMAIPPEWHYTTWCADRTIAFLEEAAPAARRGRPFLVFCSFPDPHHPFCAPEPFASMYDPASVPLPVRRPGELADLPPHMRKIYEEPLQTSGRRDPTRMPDDQLRDIIAMTYGMVSFVDQQAGRVLDAVDRLGLADDTIVVFMADHGELLGDHWLMNKGPFHFDGILNVPLMYRWPGHFPSGSATRALASHLDFAPTILDLAGVPFPEGPTPPEPESTDGFRAHVGESLVPLLTGQQENIRDVALVELDEDYLGLRLRTLITERHQITIYVGSDGEKPYGELFDLVEDPGQLWNLWHRPEARKLKRDLRDRLLIELARTDSPLPRPLAHA